MADYNRSNYQCITKCEFHIMHPKCFFLTPYDFAMGQAVVNYEVTIHAYLTSIVLASIHTIIIIYM